MLRKRGRTIQKDQQMGHVTSVVGSETCLHDVLGRKQKHQTFFNVPGLLVGSSPVSALECDSVRSPTSPLDFTFLSNLTNPFRFPKPSAEGHQKSWDCNKVGLGSIVNSLDNDDCRNLPEKPITMSNSKTILIGSQIRSRLPDSPKSVPKNYPIFPNTILRPSNLQKGSSDVFFEIGGDPLETDPFEKIQSFSLDSKRLGSEMYTMNASKIDVRSGSSGSEKQSIPGSFDPDLHGLVPSSESKLAVGTIPFTLGDELARPLSPEEIELSEDYTCVISHGPVPKTTHIFCGCVLECHPNEVDSENRTKSSEKCSSEPYPTDGLLSYCHYCKKKLEKGKDIYMYRGEKAFCSLDCRLEEISIEEGQEKQINKTTKSENGDDIFAHDR